MKIDILQDTDKAILVMADVANWMEKSGIQLSKWWELKNMNRTFLLKHTEPREFFVAVVDGKPAASEILQETERNQSWEPIDGSSPKKALYIHWLCVARAFSGQGFSKVMVDFAADEARKRGFKLLRLDTNAEEDKLCKLYEGLGFQLMGTEQEENHKTAFYQKVLV